MKFNIRLTVLRSLGIVIICLYFYLRFIRQRLPRNLYFFSIIDHNLYCDYYFLSFCLFCFILSLMGFYITLKVFLNSAIKTSKNKLLLILLQSFSYLKESLHALEEWVGDNIPDSYEKVRDFSLKIYKIFGNKEKFMVITVFVIPYMSISIIFLIDLFYLFKLKLFFFMLPLLIIPLLGNLCFYLINYLSTNLAYIEDQLQITHSFLIDNKDKFIFKEREDNRLSQEDFQHYRQEYLKIYPLKGFMKVIHMMESYYKIKALLFMYSCYLLGWCFVFYKNITLFYLFCQHHI